MGSVFGPIRFLLPVYRLLIFIHIEHTLYMPIFSHIFLSNYWWQKSDIWSQASYRYPISWEAFLDPSDSYFLFADLVGFYTHWTYMHIFRHIFLSNYWWQKSDIWSQALYRYPISWEAFLDPSDSYFLFADFVDFYTHWTYMLIFRRIFLSNYWWQKSDIWSQASYRCPISWEVFLDPSYSNFLFADFVDFYTYWTYRSLQVYQRSNTQVGQRVLSDFTPTNVRQMSEQIVRQMSDQIVRQMSDQILPGQSESLHSQIVKL